MKRIPRNGLVLPNGPSDHNPFVKDFILDGERIRVGDWNTHHDTTYKQAYRTLEEMIADLECGVLLLQEVNGGDGIARGLKRDYGWHYRSGGREFLIAWDPEVWEFVRTDVKTLSTKPYWADPNQMLVVVLRHKATGRKVKFGSYHTPAHVQAPGHVTHDNVMPVYRDAVDRRLQIARRSHIPCVFAGDGNVDPYHGWAPPGGWDFGFDRPPLIYVRAPEGTHGSRHIDEFFTLGVGLVI